MRRFTILMAVAWLGASLGGVAPPEARGQSNGPNRPAAPSSADQGGFQAVEPETQMAPFLGTATTQATPAQRAQVGLADGVGLTVQHVLRGSPAEKAGLRRFDVLHKLNDQILVNDPQFRTLLRMFEPGDAIKLGAIRRGQRVEFTVTLGRREVPVGHVPAAEMLQWLLRPTPRIEPASELAGFSARYEDAQHVLVLSTDARGKHLLAKDKQGEVLFEGDIDTPEQRASVPESLVPKLKQLESPPPPKSAREKDHAAP